MLKNLAALEIKIEDRLYQLVAHGQTTWGEIHDVLWKMKEFAVENIVKNHEAQKQEKDEEKEVSV